MDWNSIFTFLTGALAALIPIIINNRSQTKEREKDRQEQRREAKIQAREKWIERDVLKIMDSLEITLNSLSSHENFELKIDQLKSGENSGLFSKKEADAKRKSLLDELSSSHLDARQGIDTVGTIAYSFEEVEITSSYDNFAAELSAYSQEATKYMANKYRNGFAGDIKRADLLGVRTVVRKSAGNLQRALREKLISLRE